MGDPVNVTRRHALFGTTAAVATALAGCGSPGDDDGEFRNEGEDEGSPPADGGNETGG